MQFPIMVGLHRSRFMGIAIVLLHGVALAAILATPWPLEWRLLLGVAVLLHALWAWRQASKLPSSLRLYADGRLALPGEEARYTVMPGAYAHPWLTVFRFRDAGGRLRSIVVLPDSTGVDEARRLRVWLRWKLSASPEGDV